MDKTKMTTKADLFFSLFALSMMALAFMVGLSVAVFICVGLISIPFVIAEQFFGANVPAATWSPKPWLVCRIAGWVVGTVIVGAVMVKVFSTLRRVGTKRDNGPIQTSDSLPSDPSDNFSHLPDP